MDHVSIQSYRRIAGEFPWDQYAIVYLGVIILLLVIVSKRHVGLVGFKQALPGCKIVADLL